VPGGEILLPRQIGQGGGQVAGLFLAQMVAHLDGQRQNNLRASGRKGPSAPPESGSFPVARLSKPGRLMRNGPEHRKQDQRSGAERASRSHLTIRLAFTA
jgi:hypothetical protein